MDRARWRKSARSGSTGSNCIETATTGQSVAVRDSKDPDGARLAVGTRQWQKFTAAIRSGQI